MPVGGIEAKVAISAVIAVTLSEIVITSLAVPFQMILYAASHIKGQGKSDASY